MHDLIPFGDNRDFNLSHTIHRLSFGHDFPGLENPLDGVSITSETFSVAYKYFLKVVPTFYYNLSNKVINTNQYSVTEHSMNTEVGMVGNDLPGLFFYYDLSPIKVNFREERIFFLHYLTNVCAIVGGVFTVSGILDALFYHGHRIIKKKIDLGKFQ